MYFDNSFIITSIFEILFFIPYYRLHYTRSIDGVSKVCVSFDDYFRYRPNRDDDST